MHQFNSTRKNYLLVGICGRAGAGKTTLANNIVNELQDQDVTTIMYSGDWRFILDSFERRKMLNEKWKAGIDAYMYIINQLNWWDFNEIESDLDTITSNNPLSITNAYDRKTGIKDKSIAIPKTKSSIVLYENCILGGVSILEKLDIIILLNTPDRICFERTINKDSDRRNMIDIASRFIVTTYSENNFFDIILNKFSKKLLVCDSYGQFGLLPEINKVSQIPIYIPEHEIKKRQKGTIFCDLDGVLIKHVPVPSEDGNEIITLPDFEKLRKWSEDGYYIVLTSSRPYNKVFGVLNKLKGIGIEFDQVICDLPIGPRHLINDNKDNEVRAIAHALKRNNGIGSVKI